MDAKEKIRCNGLKHSLLATGIAAVSAGAQAKQTICVFDIVGKSGDVYALMKDISLPQKPGVRTLS